MEFYGSISRRGNILATTISGTTTKTGTSTIDVVTCIERAVVEWTECLTRDRGDCGFELHWWHCVLSLSKIH